MALILEKDKLIESIWEYRWWITENRFGAFTITIFKKKQYKETRGKHIEVAPRDIIKAKKQGLSEWFNLRRGYKGIEKWYVQDHEEAINQEGNNPDYFHLFFGATDLKDFKQLTEMNYEQLVRLAYALHTYLSRHQPLERSDFGTLADTWKARDDLQFELTEDIHMVSLAKVRNTLKKWVADDSHYMDEGLGKEVFGNIYSTQQGDYFTEVHRYCFGKALKSKTEKSEKYWYSQHNKFGEQGQSWNPSNIQAEFYWENESKKINTDKHRAEYLQSIGIDLEEISYKPQN
jgi:hypothetical protein